MKDRRVIIATFVYLITVLLVCGGYTYSYLVVENVGNDLSSVDAFNSITDLSLSLDATSKIDLSGLEPGISASKTFTVTNNSSKRIDAYTVNLDNVINTYTKPEEVVYTLSCTASSGTCASKDETVFPTSSGIILISEPIEIGVTHTYTLTITFKELGSNQNYNMNGNISYKITIN